MQALLCTRLGTPDDLTLAEVPDPAAGPGEAVIRVHSVALNFFDTLIIAGKYQIRPALPFSPGAELAGTIESLGAGVRDLAVGDRVMAYCRFGAAREKIALPAEQIIRIPAGLDFDRAAGLCVIYGTALYALKDRGGLKSGETLAVLGASGGVGLAAMEIGKLMGARVIACASSAAKLKRLQELGADHVIDYTKEDFSRRAWEISGKKGVDVLVNYTGGDTWVPSLRTLARYGRLLTCGATAGFDPKTDIRYIWRREVNIIGANGWTRQDLEALLSEVERGSIKPIIHGVYPLAESREAMRVMEDREVFGKIIVTP